MQFGAFFTFHKVHNTQRKTVVRGRKQIDVEFLAKVSIC